MSAPLVFYRYESVQYASADDDELLPALPNPCLEIRTLNLHRETLKGYWIGYGLAQKHTYKGMSRWVSKSGKKRYAYPSKEEALINFIKRTSRRIKILKYQVTSCEIALSMAQKTRTTMLNSAK